MSYTGSVGPSVRSGRCRPSPIERLIQKGFTRTKKKVVGVVLWVVSVSVCSGRRFACVFVFESSKWVGYK